MDHVSPAADTHTYDILELGLERLMRTEQSCASLENYVSALVSLWKEQTAMMQNSFPHPRSAHVRVLSDALKKMEEKGNKRAYVDKGLSSYQSFAFVLLIQSTETIFDGYQSRDEVALSYESYFNRGNLEGLRDMTAQSFGLFGLLRGDNQRKVALSELGSTLLPPDEGPTECLALVAITRGSKTNTKGLTQYAAMMRAKDVFMCPVWSLSSYLFAR